MAKGVKSSFSRTGIGFGVLVQTVCVVFLFVATNYIGFNYYKRWDFSRSQKFTLADQTEQVLRQVQPTLKIVVYFSPSSMGLDAAIYGDVQNLLAQYAFSARRKIEIRQVDPSREVSEARELQEKYKFDGAQNVLILDYEGRVKILPILDMGEFDFSGLQSGDAAQLLYFKGEEVLTAALFELLNPKKALIYFSQGHGETMPTRLFVLNESMAKQNSKPVSFNLGIAEAVPEDADAVCIVGARYDFTEAEIKLLRLYWESSGRIVVLLDPTVNTPNLRKFLNEIGIYPRPDRVQRLAASPTQATYAILRSLVRGIFLPDSAITKRLVGANAMFTGPTQSLLLDNVGASREDIVLRPLVQAAEEYWGETAFTENEGKGITYNDSEDAGAPVVVAASAEKGAAKDDRTDVASARMVVVGNSAFVEDESLRQAPANLDFILSIFNRMIDNRSKLTGIAPRSAASFALSLTSAQIRSISLYTLIIIPGAAALLGIVVGLRRRA
jgi:ABC-type uncharacterized transport system